MKNVLISLLESLSYPVFLQGSIDNIDSYPDDFFTFWNYENPESAYYDNQSNRCVYGFYVYFYSVNPIRVEQVTEQARQLLKRNGWKTNGKPIDIPVDSPTHTGAFFKARYTNYYQKESVTNG